jgi:hypothetical protein
MIKIRERAMGKARLEIQRPALPAGGTNAQWWVQLFIYVRVMEPYLYFNT